MRWSGCNPLHLSLATYKKKKNMVAPFKPKGAKKARGVDCERRVQAFLEKWVAVDPVHREANRLPDTKAAGRITKAAPADFDFYCYDSHTEEEFFGLIEAKETEHEYRLPKARVTQLPTMMRRARCGGLCVVVVYHSTIKMYRAFQIYHLHNTEGASIDLRNWPLFYTVEEALSDVNRVFDL